MPVLPFVQVVYSWNVVRKIRHCIPDCLKPTFTDSSYDYRADRHYSDETDYRYAVRKKLYQFLVGINNTFEIAVRFINLALNLVEPLFNLFIALGEHVDYLVIRHLLFLSSSVGVYDSPTSRTIVCTSCYGLICAKCGRAVERACCRSTQEPVNCGVGVVKSR